MPNPRIGEIEDLIDDHSIQIDDLHRELMDLEEEECIREGNNET